MDLDLEFRIGDESICELIVRRDDAPRMLSFYVAFYLSGRGFGPARFPLGRFLRSLGLTTEDCASALGEDDGMPEGTEPGGG